MHLISCGILQTIYIRTGSLDSDVILYTFTLLSYNDIAIKLTSCLDVIYILVLSSYVGWYISVYTIIAHVLKDM